MLSSTGCHGSNLIPRFDPNGPSQAEKICKVGDRLLLRLYEDGSRFSVYDYSVAETVTPKATTTPPAARTPTLRTAPTTSCTLFF